jgi:hypothetical protein
MARETNIAFNLSQKFAFFEVGLPINISLDYDPRANRFKNFLRVFARKNNDQIDEE